MKDDTVKDGTVRVGTVKDGTVKDSTVKDGTVKVGTVNVGTVKDGTVGLSFGLYTLVRHAFKRYTLSKLSFKDIIHRLATS